VTEIISIENESIVPTLSEVYDAQGVPRDRRPTKEIEATGQKALGLFIKTAKATGILAEISHSEFASIYHGMGKNEYPAPIEDIYERSDSLALCAATVGQAVCALITDLFEAGDFLLGTFLDTVASVATDRASHILEIYYKRILGVSDVTVLCYSPGYCGWHVSAQKKLFEYLRPEQIGISLRDSLLMEPLKSISGVLLAGPAEIHEIDNSYPFCGQCRMQPCRNRQPNR